MPISLSVPERLLLRLGVIPAPLVDFGQHAAYRLLLAGHRLGVFDALAEGPLPLPALSERLDAQPDALEHLLDLLRQLGYLSLRDGRYANTPVAMRYLSTGSPQTLTGLVGMLEELVGRWDHLEQTIKNGRPLYTAYEYFDQHPELWPAFHDGQRTIAQFTTEEVARKARLDDGRPLRLIDVGGSHGLYTIALCRRYPRLTAVIYDWPQGVAAAEREIARSGLGGRISTRTGDFLKDDLGSGYDVALLGNIIHGQTPAAIRVLFLRLHGALVPGATLLILDQVRVWQPFTRFAGYMAALTGLILLNELGGALYPYKSVRSWLHETGYRDVRLRRLLHAPGNVLIQARQNGRA